jgi:hypothetical protein
MTTRCRPGSWSSALPERLGALRNWLTSLLSVVRSMMAERYAEEFTNASTTLLRVSVAVSMMSRDVFCNRTGGTGDSGRHE